MTNMHSASAADISATEAIPVIYRLIITTLEPIFALAGSLTVITNPSKYLDSLTRSRVPFDRATSFLYTELVGAWLMFAFIEAVVFRLVDNHRVWKLICIGMLASDVLYCHSCAEAVGGWSAWLQVGDWTAGDWAVFVTTAPPVLTSVLIVLDIGVRLPRKKTS